MSNFAAAASVFLVWATIVIGSISAYITHIVWAVKALMADATSSQMLLAIIGSVIPPLGVIHGIVLWFT